MAVDRSKFRTCSQTSFCRRNRNGRSQPAYQYSLDPASIEFHNGRGHAGAGSAEAGDSAGAGAGAEDASSVEGEGQVQVPKEEEGEGTGTEKGEEDHTAAAGRGGVIQTIKKMFTSKSHSHSTGSSNGGKVDPYIRGPGPYFTAKLTNDAPVTSTGTTEKLNLAIHLHDDGVARIRITEEYGGTGGDHDHDYDHQPYSNARWTSDELILNHEEMKSASDVFTIDESTPEGKELLGKLLGSLDVNSSSDNYVGFRFGDNHESSSNEKSKCTDSSSMFLIQFQPFALHLWRDNCKQSKEGSSGVDYGLPAVSINSDNLMHFEIRRLKEEEKERLRQEEMKAQANAHAHDKESVGEEKGDGAVVTGDTKDKHDEEEEDRHGGKEVVGYWEDGLAIYADGTREERKEEEPLDPNADSIAEEKRRSLMDMNEGGGFYFDTDGMWEEKFGPHTDSKPYGPMSVGADITFPASTHLFGLPEHASSTQLKGTTGVGSHYKEPYRLYNLDVFEYELDETMALYGEVPLIVSQSKTSGTVGVFWFNPTETFVDVENSNGASGKGTKTHWISESGIIDLFILPGPNPKSLYEQYATLTGRMPLPPMWSLGYHQCRWNYRDQEDVYHVHGKFEELDYPYDVLWLDIEHTSGKRYFTWDKHLFPNPIPMQQKLKSQGRNMVTIIDPHIKRDNHYYIHNQATAKGLYIKDKTGKNDYDGWCWPGSSSYLDFTNEEVRNWWADQFSYNSYVGSTPSLFTWNDMNEPSVFNGPEVSMQKDLRNLDGIEHREWHNLYGTLFQRATAEGLTRRNPGENVRPFVLSRSFFAGSQRYGSIWTGDNESSWPHLKVAAPMLLSLNTAALSFVGADVGGFFGNPDAELMTRWMQAGAYQPFFRGHAHHDSKRREPWIFGEVWMSRMRHAAMARYALLPYWYTIFREAGVTGMPVMRTMWMQYPELEELYGTDDQYLIGSDLLIKPVTEAHATKSEVAFPLEHDWYDVDTMMSMPLSKGNGVGSQALSVSSDIDKIPVYQRGGSIIARKLRLRRSTQMMVNDPYTLYIAIDSTSKEATGVLYMDDEFSFDHEKKGSFGEAKFKADLKNKFISNKVNAESQWVASTSKSSRMIERVIIMGVEEPPTTMHLQSIELHFSYDRESKVLVIRKPNVSALDDWEIKLS